MIYPPEWLDIIQSAPDIGWDGAVYRHMFGDIPPVRSNTGGARWNPPGREAIYASCEAETALAEAEHQISLQPLVPKAKRTLYTLRVSLRTTVDLRNRDLLSALGVTPSELENLDMSGCQRVGEAVAWLKYEGLLARIIHVIDRHRSNDARLPGEGELGLPSDDSGWIQWAQAVENSGVCTNLCAHLHE